jgi:hypothetical protein
MRLPRIADKHATRNRRIRFQESASRGVSLLNGTIDCGGAVMWLALSRRRSFQIASSVRVVFARHQY